MEIKSYSRVSVNNANEKRGEVIFTKPDVIVVNPFQVLSIESYNLNGKDLFEVNGKESQEVFCIMFSNKRMFIDKKDRTRLAGVLDLTVKK